MATAVDPAGGSPSDAEPARSEAFKRLSRPPYELHRAVFNRDLPQAKRLLAESKDVVNAQDCHGNTPLHIAVMLGHEDIISLLIENRASAKEKNILGWTPLNEAVSFGNRNIISSLLKRVADEMREGLLQRRFQLVQALRNLDDFYAELKWEFHTWVPLLSRLLPNDVCRIYKTGCCVRLDSTLGDFTEMQWSRGDISFIYNGESTESSNALSIVALDNKKRVYQRLSLNSREDIDVDTNDHIDNLMTRPIVYANMSTQPITVTRAQTGFLFFRQNRSEQVGNYLTDVYNITDLILISRKRREHLTPEQIKRYEELSQKVERGEISEELSTEVNEDDSENKEHFPSLSPPPPTSMTWEEYIFVDQCPHLGRPMDLRIERRNFRATVYMTENCPIEMKKLLDILEVIAPYKHFHKLRDFVSLKLPAGFPVKMEIPVFPTVTAVISLQHYEHKQFPPTQFLIPRNYTKYVPKSNEDSSNAENQ